MRNWTKKELASVIALRLQGLKWAQVAESIGRSESSLWVKLSQIGIKIHANGRDEAAIRENLLRLHDEFVRASVAEESKVSEEAPEVQEPESKRTLADTTIDEDMEDTRRRILLAEARESKRKYVEVLANRALDDRIVDVFRERLEAFVPSAKAPPLQLLPVSKMGKRPESAVLVISDTHIGQVVSSGQTNGFGNYNPRVYCERLHYMQEMTLEVIRQVPAGIDELVVLLLGDILHGALDHGAEREDNAVVADQFQLAVWSLHQFICNLAFHVPVVKIYTVVGNHGRWPGMRRMPTSYRYSNLDHLVYASLQLSLRVHGMSNVTMFLNDAARQIVDIKGSRFVCQHGDAIRGGDKQFGIPVHGMTRDVNATLQRFAAVDDKGADYFVMGDKHKSMSLPLARGEYIVNGSMVGSDEFSMSFCPAEPMQLLFGVDEKLRKTWSYPLKVTHAPSQAVCPFHLPPQIEHLLDNDPGSLAA